MCINFNNFITIFGQSQEHMSQLLFSDISQHDYLR